MNDARPFLNRVFPALVAHGLRLVIGIVFIYAGYIKILDPFAFAKNIYHYQLLPDVAVNIAAWLLPWLEVLTGAALILAPRWRRAAAAWILVMLTVFTGAILISLYRGLDISCGCMSTDPGAARIGWRKVAENIALWIGTAVAFYGAARHPSSPDAKF
ncbi:MAG TPA: MauE/DoxX family redox-associated membrane protein [Kiritimatiellia bacterium]|nr:MauE/DoxX family redox-associated membrane protein [Kiritimatiellia bacterium]HMO98963.1 MauE/DoxX family redox-associated membrane protein [Kiritimatiellia bacterium]HMP96413.1 MauE/DoxX family redox-associated membrane protein [Kiritimatiellia bacterium]